MIGFHGDAPRSQIFRPDRRILIGIDKRLRPRPLYLAVSGLLRLEPLMEGEVGLLLPGGVLSFGEGGAVPAPRTPVKNTMKNLSYLSRM